MANIEQRITSFESLLFAAALGVSGCIGVAPVGELGEAQSAAAAGGSIFSDPSGQFTTLSTTGAIDTSTNNPFFQSLGTNGRSCGSCHLPSDGWTISAAHAQQIFDATQGLDPLFRPIDGATSPSADVSTLAARQSAYVMLRTKGLIRVALPVPANAEFTVVAVDDPYHAPADGTLGLFRRPPPSANLTFLSTVMWDGREMPFGTTMDARLLHQALDATLGHAQASDAPNATQLRAIVDFEESLFAAQTWDNNANDLTAKQGQGGPTILSTQNFYLGINDVLGGDPNKVPFTPNAMTLYASWAGSPGSAKSVDGARASIARGEALFNTKPIQITGVGGLNDALGQPTIAGTCTTCHDAPNAGDHSTALPIDIGITDVSRRTPDLPLYTLQNNVTLAQRQTTDPGRAMVTGKWADIGKFKGPVLRAVATRAPYFHNGSAATLDDVVNFYDSRFGIGFTAQEHADLVAFLSTL